MFFLGEKQRLRPKTSGSDGAYVFKTNGYETVVIGPDTLLLAPDPLLLDPLSLDPLFLDPLLLNPLFLIRCHI